MKLIRREKYVGMFKRYFFMLSCLVMICLMVSSMSLMFFVSSYWSTDTLNSLWTDARAVADDIEALYARGITDIKYNDQIVSTLSAISDASLSDVFVVRAVDGTVVLCKDMLALSDDGIQTHYRSCDEHGSMRFSSETLSEVYNTYGMFTYKGKLHAQSELDYFVAAVPVRSDSAVSYYVFAAQPLSAGYQPYIKQYLRMTVTASLLAVFMAFFCSLVASYRIVHPLKKMSEATKHYAKGDFSMRIKSPGKFLELHDLAEAFNRMAVNLEEIEDSRKSFVANVSHELKTPITTIGGFIDGMLDGTVPLAEQKHYLQIVSDEVKRLSKLVIAMLNMSKIEAGQLELSYSEFNYPQLVIHTFVGFEKSISDKHIVVTGLDKLEDIHLRADEALITQVVYNLVDNAVKFTKNGQALRVELFEEKHCAVLKVRNYGSSIPEDELKSIFDRFYKLDKSRGLDASSFGLGLYIVRSIVEMHGGTIKAYSMENEYTEFMVRLPL